MSAAPLSGLLVDRYGERPFLATGLAMRAVGLGRIALIAAPDLAYAAMSPALMIAACSVSMAMPAAQNAAVGAVASAAIGKAARTNRMLRELGGVLGLKTVQWEPVRQARPAAELRVVILG